MGKDEYLFQSPYKKDKPMTRQLIFMKLKKIDPNLHPHLFRHSRLTDLATVLDLYEIHAFAGWKIKPETASHYIYLQWIHRAEKILFKKRTFGYG